MLTTSKSTCQKTMTQYFVKIKLFNNIIIRKMFIYYRNGPGNHVFPGISKWELVKLFLTKHHACDWTQWIVTLLVSGLVVCCCGPLGALLLSVLWPLPALRVLPILPVLLTLFLSPAARELEALIQWVNAIVIWPRLGHHSSRLHCHASVPPHSCEDTVPTVPMGWISTQAAGRMGWG